MIRLTLLTLGYFFLVLGAIGIVAPVLPGWIFIFVGLIILGKYAAWARRWLSWLKARHPHVDRFIGRAEVMATRWIRLITVRLGRLGRAGSR